MMEPANTIIAICGGFRAVSEMTGRNETRVRRWAYPKSRGGTGGYIPAEVQQVLLAKARRAGCDLRPEHFFPGVIAAEELASDPGAAGGLDHSESCAAQNSGDAA
jgi:hypothetical protein